MRSSTGRPSAELHQETHLLALHLPEGRVGGSLEAAELSLQFPPLPLGDRGGVHSLAGIIQVEVRQIRVNQVRLEK